MFERLRAVIGDRRVIPPVPDGRISHLPITEADEPAPPPKSDHSASTSCFIEYTNAKGEDSSRVITFRSISGHYGEPETIRAHCHLRGAHRSFVVRNIRSMVCTETGEELDPVEHCLALHRHGALKIEDKALARVMRIVTFMARCDGEFHALEKEAVEDEIGRYLRIFGGDDAAYECASREALRLAPEGGDVITALEWIKRAPRRGELARFVLDAGASVIDADHQHKPEEIEWGIELSGALKRMAAR